MCTPPTEDQCVTLTKRDLQTMKPVIKVEHQGVKDGHTGISFKIFFVKYGEIVTLSPGRVKVGTSV